MCCREVKQADVIYNSEAKNKRYIMLYILDGINKYHEFFISEASVTRSLTINIFVFIFDYTMVAG